MASRQPVATSTSNPPTRPASPESHESFTRRNNAAEILQSYEKLSWYSYERCEVSLTHPRKSSSKQTSQKPHFPLPSPLHFTENDVDD